MGPGLEIGGPVGASASASDAASAGPSTRSTRGVHWARASPETAARLEAAGVPSVRVERAMERATVARGLADTMFGGDDDSDESDDDDGGFSGFVNSIRNMDSMRGAATFSFTGLPPGMHLSPPPMPLRSYASNMHDATAGGSADNALEIQDSDEDEEVQVLGSFRTRGSRSRSSRSGSA